MDVKQSTSGIQEISQELKSKLECTNNVSNKNCTRRHYIIKTCIQLQFQVLKESLENYDTSQLFLSFNGGKDCTVLLHLLINFFQNNSYDFTDLKIIYMQPEQPFVEIELFIENCINDYSIYIEKINGDIRKVLEVICNSNKAMKACFMGSRQTDPYCQNLKAFQVNYKILF